MTVESSVQEQLERQFPFLKEKVKVQRQRRIFADAPSDRFMDVFDYAVKQMNFSILCTITGVDLGANLGAIYHLARTSGEVLSLSVSVDKQSPALQTVTPYFPAADCYERELIDLLGMKVQGLPPGSRYPLPDGWPEGQYPLRKDWKPETSEKSEASHAE
jgi:membrane-bound hydrogenase subunit beta